MTIEHKSIVTRVVMTGKVNSVISKNLEKPHIAEIINTAEIATHPTRSQLSGQQTHTRFTKPMNVKSMVERLLSSAGESVDVWSSKIKTIKMLINSSSAHGMDFFKTCLDKFVVRLES